MLRRDRVADACGRSAAMTGGDIGYIILVLHPGDTAWSPTGNLANTTDDVHAYRMGYGLDTWISPVPAGRIRHDDPPVLCSCGFDVHKAPKENEK